MALPAALLASILLLAGFLALTRAEERHGRRVLGGMRDALDRAVVALTRGGGSLAAHGISAGSAYAARSVVHGILAGVRAAERFLTRAARTLREREAALARSPLAARIRRFFGKGRMRGTPEDGPVE